jgi:mRNA-degrading endonuclease RelE of RelBE toxin-antitoxin system
MVQVQITVSLSEKLHELGGRAHRKASKLAAIALLQLHHRKNIPQHFKQTGRNKYHYKARSARYKAYKRKRWHSITDLVASGRNRQLITAMGTIRVGGTITGSPKRTSMSGKTYGSGREPGLRAQLRMRGNWPEFRDSTNPRAVTINDMRDEIARVTEDENTSLAQYFKDIYVRELSTYSGNIRKKVYNRK